MILMVAYLVITLLLCGQVALTGSFVVGGSALVGFALCYFATATFFGSFYARREKKYSMTDLAGIGGIAVVLVAAGLALVVWSGFWLNLFGVTVSGLVWALIGIVVAVLTTKKQHAL
jgi:hypothetical protein